MTTNNKHIIICDNATIPKCILGTVPNNHLLNLVKEEGLKGKNLSIKIKNFSSHLIDKIPDRVRDLIEIASFIYGADRLIKRGEIDQLEYKAWSRGLTFCIPVRDIVFWNNPNVKKKLTELLIYISGDSSYDFYFEKSTLKDKITNLFELTNDTEVKTKVNDTGHGYSVGLFSGGLDSLAGIIELLETTVGRVIITSHRANPKTIKTQQKVYNSLKAYYPNRLSYHPLECNLNGARGTEETQRTRFFLYTAVGFTLARMYGNNELNIFENGITSINLSKRQDLINARASRTTHPKTISLLNELYSEIANERFIIQHPFLYRTKTEVINTIKKYGKQNIIADTVTCTKTFKAFENKTQASHCGYCSQCVDRRFAMFAADLQNFDAVYDFDLATESFPHSEARTHVIDYMAHAKSFASLQFDSFYSNYLDPLADLTENLDSEAEFKEIERLFKLYKTHCSYIESAYGVMRIKYDSIFSTRIPNSLYEIVDERPYMKPKAELMADSIGKMLLNALPIALNHLGSKLSHENELNDIINALLQRDQAQYEREYPFVRFSFSTIVTDHSLTDTDKDLFVESKYLRKKTPPSKITNELGADLIKYPQNAFKLFVIYDPERRIADDGKFSRDFEKRGDCKIFVIR